MPSEIVSLKKCSQPVGKLTVTETNEFMMDKAHPAHHNQMTLKKYVSETPQSCCKRSNGAALVAAACAYRLRKNDRRSRTAAAAWSKSASSAIFTRSRLRSFTASAWRAKSSRSPRTPRSRRARASKECDERFARLDWSANDVCAVWSFEECVQCKSARYLDVYNDKTTKEKDTLCVFRWGKRWTFGWIKIIFCKLHWDRETYLNKCMRRQSSDD